MSSDESMTVSMRKPIVTVQSYVPHSYVDAVL